MIDTDILVILDRSGSMAKGRTDHEGGLRSFVDDQQALAGDVRLTLVQFDDHDPCDVVYDRTPIHDVTRIELVPRGGTPLLSAVGRAIAHLKGRQANEPADQTIVMVITDGEDTGGNGEWTKVLVQQHVKDLEKQGWAFLYLGANVDAFDESAALGVAAAAAANYRVTSAGIRQAYAFTAANVASARSMRAAGQSIASASASLNYTDVQRSALMADDNVVDDGHSVTVGTTTTGNPTVSNTVTAKE